MSFDFTQDESKDKLTFKTKALTAKKNEVSILTNMYIYVKLLNGFPQSLLYKVPQGLIPGAHRGSIVRVPIRNTLQPAIIINAVETLPSKPEFEIREIHGFDPFPQDPTYHTFIQQLSSYYQIDPLYFYKRIRHFLSEEIKTTNEGPTSEFEAQAQVTLTDEQQAVCNFLQPAVSQSLYTPTLVHGITGSGKTEIYKNLISHAIAEKKSALLLLPEVTLALQFQKLLSKQLPHVALHGFHSGMSAREKKILWQRLLNQEPVLIIGVHLPVLLPIPNLGIILIDEEHDVGYQEKKHPKINSKDAALLKAQTANIPIVLGSATPSIASLYNVHHRGWHFFELKQRFSGALPTIELVQLNDKKQRKSFWISKQLEREIGERLEKREQTILFLNRRGYCFFVQCKECNHIITCDACSVSLTLHEDNTLTCHYCSLRMQKPTSCPSCKKTDFLHKGIGTQQLVTIVQKLFPNARIARADLDVTAKKKTWDATVKDFEQGALDILIGTQTITKGFHFPNVTLVGIIWGDLNVHFPMYNAAEIALQQLIQVAGRAGRARNESKVIVQTLTDHALFKYLNEVRYPQFYTDEIHMRMEVSYPPAVRLAEIELKHTCENTIEKEAMALTQFLLGQAKIGSGLIVLGPAKPPVHMIKKTHMRKIYIKAKTMSAIVQMVRSIDRTAYASAIYYTPNPLN